MSERFNSIFAALAIGAFVSMPLSHAAADDAVDPFKSWTEISTGKLHGLQGGSEGDGMDIDSHNVVMSNDSVLTGENHNTSISNVGGTVSTGFTSTTVSGNRGFTGVVSNTGNMNNFIQNFSVNLYVK